MRGRARGFTILELIIATSIALTVLAVGYLAISTTVSASNDSAARIHETENERLFFNMLQRDLSTAFPGPGNIVKSPREFLSQGAAYSHNADAKIVNGAVVTQANPSPMVMTETATKNDIIQFYCRTQEANTKDQFVFVRYFVNYKDNTLCRAATVYDPNTVDITNLPDYSPPTLLTSVSNFDVALFDNVNRFSILYRHWNPTTKVYESEAFPQNTDPAVCDNLLITVVFTDVAKNKRLVANNPKGSIVQSKIDATYRSYSKSISIPASFKQ